MKRHSTPSFAPARRQQGIVLIFALITLVIMLIGAVALSRSINASQYAVGNLGFKRDLTNQGERALQIAMDVVRTTGALASASARNADLKSANYASTMLASNSYGIPNALLSDAAFNAVGVGTNDITVSDMGVTIRYVIDRMATTTGNCSATTCAMANQIVFGGSSSEWINSQSNSSASGSTNPSAVPQQPIYRITLRVSGPRNTMSFFQSTFTN